MNKINKVITTIFEKMGNWFGIVFKILVPFFVMYRPIKSFVFTIVLLMTTYGGSMFSSTNMGLFVFIIVYSVFVLLLFLVPKVASATEFALIIWYVIFLIILDTSGFSSLSAENALHIQQTYSQELPWVMVFLAGKIFVFFFVKLNSKEYVKQQERKNRPTLRS